MNEHTQDGAALLASALNPGESIVPQRLLDAVGCLSSPLEFLAAIDPEGEPFEAFRQDYPALHLRRCGARSLTPEEMEQAIGLLRWMLRELAAWTHKLDPRLDKVAAMLVLLNEFDWDDAQWAMVPDTVVNVELIKMFINILKGYRIEIHGEPGHRRSGSIDVVSELVKADSNADWVGISGYWRQIEPWLPGGGIISRALPCLARFAMNDLASVMNEVSQIQTAYFVARSLSEVNRLRLARATTSHRYRFAAALSISWGNHVFPGIGDEAESEFAALLEELSQNADQWTRWMQAFNKHPIRFPALQRPLGRALVPAPEHALAIYVDSISLSTWPINGSHYRHPSRPDGRQCVALCLSVFREAASTEQRLRLWRLAHTRWTRWALDRDSSSQRHLSSIVGTELDYAITAYAAENLSPEVLETVLASLSKDIHGIEMNWYSSFSELVSHRYVLLSMMQPLLAVNGSDWLFKQPVVPEELVENSYTKQRYKA